jgi:Zn finger protein HypA/HybF involved in hydrogenase expression
MPAKRSYDYYLKKFKKIHKNKYHYPKNQEIVDTNTYIMIKCPIHGWFKQTIVAHGRGRGCNKCAHSFVGKSNSKTYDFYLKRFKLQHGDKYHYPKYQKIENNTSKIMIKCKTHGWFKQQINNHLSGNGCPKCGFENTRLSRKKSYETHILECKTIHKSNYEYNYNVSSEDINVFSKIEIKCPIHGWFEQTIDAHKRGCGCPQCGFILRADKKRISYHDYIERAKEKHNNLYSYVVDQELPKGIYTKIKIKCSMHGWFEQTLNDHLSGTRCPGCFSSFSLYEVEIRDWLKSIGVENVVNNNRFTFKNKKYELDIYLPDYNFGIEFDGLYWHSDQFKDKNYHRDKTEFFHDAFNINIIHIFENEWVEKKDIVKSIIKSKLNKINNIHYARKCKIRELKNDVYRDFLLNNHIQGYKSATHRFGLFENNTLLMVMSFSKPRFDHNYDFENIRTCSKLNTVVVGGFSKLLKHFLSIEKTMSIVSYIDLRYFLGDAYIKSGFEFVRKTNPNYFYFLHNSFVLYTRHRFQKHKLNYMLQKYDVKLTEYENMVNNDYLRIFDCGNLKLHLAK